MHIRILRVYTGDVVLPSPIKLSLNHEKISLKHNVWACFHQQINLMSSSAFPLNPALKLGVLMRTHSGPIDNLALQMCVLTYIFVA